MHFVLLEILYYLEIFNTELCFIAVRDPDTPILKPLLLFLEKSELFQNLLKYAALTSSQDPKHISSAFLFLWKFLSWEMLKEEI